MRITVVGPVYPYRGGIAHHTTMLTKALAEKHEVQVISFKRQYPKWLYPGKSDKDPSSLKIIFPAAYLLDPLNFISWVTTVSHIEKFESQVVVIPWWTTFFSPVFTFISLLLRIKKIPVIYLIHNVIPHEPRFLDNFLVKICLGFGKSHILQSENERRRLLNILPDAETTICAHPIYQFDEKEYLSNTKSRKILNLPQKSTVLLFFGIVRPYKGLKFLIEALCIPPLSDLEPYLIVAGEIWNQKAEYTELIDRLGLSEKVVLVDRYIPNEELSTYFAASDVLVVPYLEGTQSGVLKLGMGYQIPIVASDFLVADLNQEESKYKIFAAPPGDSTILAKTIAQCLHENRSRDWRNERKDESEPGWGIFVETIEQLARKHSIPNHKYKG